MLFNHAAESKQAPLDGPGCRNFCVCLGKRVAGCSALEETACLENGISHPRPIIWLRIETVQETLLASQVSLVRKWGLSSSQGASRAPHPTPAGGGQSGPSHPIRITHTQHLGLLRDSQSTIPAPFFFCPTYTYVAPWGLWKTRFISFSASPDYWRGGTFS